MSGMSRSGLLGTVRGDGCGEEGRGRAGAGTLRSAPQRQQRAPHQPETPRNQSPLRSPFPGGKSTGKGGRPIGERGLRSSQLDREVSEGAGLTPWGG